MAGEWEEIKRYRWKWNQSLPLNVYLRCCAELSGAPASVFLFFLCSGMCQVNLMHLIRWIYQSSMFCRMIPIYLNLYARSMASPGILLFSCDSTRKKGEKTFHIRRRGSEIYDKGKKSMWKILQLQKVEFSRGWKKENCKYFSHFDIIFMALCASSKNILQDELPKLRGTEKRDRHRWRRAVRVEWNFKSFSASDENVYVM